MGKLEVEELFHYGKIYRDVVLHVPGRISGSFKVALMPGLSDAHAHPQVIDVGERGRWKNSYEWIANRKLRVREEDLRGDPELSSKLTIIALTLSLLDGVTMIAITGSLQGNLLALRRLKYHPRVIMLPTILNKKGWMKLEDVYTFLPDSTRLDGGKISAGIFIHSIGLTDPKTVKEAISLGKGEKIPVAMHLNEGVGETEVLRKITGNNLNEVVAIHCIEESEECKRLGLRVVSCPLSNLYLYERTIPQLEFIDAFGSDWPLVTGTLRRALSTATSIYKRELEVLDKATRGGYEVYNINHELDISLYDDTLERIVTGEAHPRTVIVGGQPTVIEGKLDGIDRGEAERALRETINEALSLYGVDP